MVDDFENIDGDLFGKQQPDQLRQLADYVESEHGKVSKANQLRSLADEMELYRPVIKGILEVRSGDYATDKLEAAVKKWDDHFYGEE